MYKRQALYSHICHSFDAVVYAVQIVAEPLVEDCIIVLTVNLNLISSARISRSKVCSLVKQKFYILSRLIKRLVQEVKLLCPYRVVMKNCFSMLCLYTKQSFIDLVWNEW